MDNNTSISSGTVEIGNCLPPYTNYPYISPYVPQTSTWVFQAPVTQCSGDIHLFPCPHCKVCKCGKAHLA